MVTGTSVLGVKFTGGVILAADMLGSYGSLARFRNISRLMKVMLCSSPSAVQCKCAAVNTSLWVSGEQQHHPGGIGGLR